MLSAQLTAFAQKIPALPELQFVENKNRTLLSGDRWSYMEAGSKTAPAIICMHGIGGNSMDWRYQLAGLSKKYRVIAWNAPGYMLSDDFNTDSPSPKDMADALADTQANNALKPIVANVTTDLTSKDEDIKRLLVEQVTGRVRWRESMLDLKNHGITHVVEIGAGRVLTGLVKRIDPELQTSTVNTLADLEAFFQLVK